MAAGAGAGMGGINLPECAGKDFIPSRIPTQQKTGMEGPKEDREDGNSLEWS